MPPSRSAKAASDADAASTRPADAQASWFGDIDAEDRFQLGLEDRHGASTQASAYVRLYRAFVAARALLGLILVGGIATSTLLERAVKTQTLVIVGLYAALAIMWWWWRPQPEHMQRRTQGQEHGVSKRQTLSTVGIDLVFFTLLSQFDQGVNLNFAALMALPVLMGSVLLSRFMALAVAAAATLLLLVQGVLNSLGQQALSDTLPAAGFAGFGLFAVAVVVSELSSRLASEQRSSRDHMELARQQAQLNRLVIEEMPEGVLAVDRQGQVRSANPSARRLLSAHGQIAAPPFQLRGVPAWGPLVNAIESAFAQQRRIDDSREILLTFDDQTRRGLRMRLKFTRSRPNHPQDDVCVVFLEDLRHIHARARQDKLAAMGRMSAGVAHEIRNPLAAISQANALLSEDATNATQHKLTSMVADNVNRLKRIVDDILEVAPGMRPPSPLIDIDKALKSIIDEWQELHPNVREQHTLKLDMHGIPPRELGLSLQVRFDPDHLRRVLVNLLDNAVRHGSKEAGAVRVEAQYLTGTDVASQICVAVFSDGAPIDASVEGALFEPFFSTRSRGTGLGLYICRELCEQHDATIDYRSHPPTQRHRNEFYVLMLVATAPSTPTS